MTPSVEAVLVQSMNKSLGKIKTNDMKFEEFKKENISKMEVLDKINKDNENIINDLKMKLDENIFEIQKKPKELFKCTKCNFESQSKKGLNTHITRKHTDTAILKFPKKCDLCDKDLDSEKELRKHL